MDIDCISDLHGYYPAMKGGDLLIVAGDLTVSDKREQYVEFIDWIVEQKYTRKIVIAGNHDNILQKDPDFFCVNRIDEYTDLDYLCDSGTEFEGLKIWGSPWTKTFKGINPKCKAFTVDTDAELAEKWNLIPPDTNILVTHCPPYGLFDCTQRNGCVGSVSLREAGFSLKNLKLWVFGHIHECGGRTADLITMRVVNASHIDECCDPIYKPIRVTL